MLTNEYFLDQVPSQSGREELAQGMEDLIRMQLEEISFTPKVIPPDNITLPETQIDEKTNTRFILVPRRHPSKQAYTIPFIGELPTEYIETDRYRVDFYWIETNKKTMDIKELENLEQPIEQWVQETQTLEIDKKIDGRFIEACDVIVTGTGNKVEVATATGNIERAHYVDLQQKHMLSKTPIGMMLMADLSGADVLRWKHEETGDILGKIVVDGITFNTIHGKPYTTTIKHEMVPFGVIWMFTTKEYLGVYKTLHSIEFKIEFLRDEVTMWTKCEIGLGIGNTAGITKLIVTKS